MSQVASKPISVKQSRRTKYGLRRYQLRVYGKGLPVEFLIPSPRNGRMTCEWRALFAKSVAKALLHYVKAEGYE